VLGTGVRPSSLLFIAGTLLLACTGLLAHDLSSDNADYVKTLSGAAPGPFLYLGAKHMFTGYDHLLFLLGVIFFLYRTRDVLVYVTLFTLGHSLTLFLGVWLAWRIDEHLIDTIIGLSIVYKAFENMGGFRTVAGSVHHTNQRAALAVFVFGLFHGLGLATRLQNYISHEQGLFINLLSFNLGVELGQLAALGLMLLLLIRWRTSGHFRQHAFTANTVLMCAGFVLAGNQFAGYIGL